VIGATVGSSPPPVAATALAPQTPAPIPGAAPAASPGGAGGPGKATVAMMIESAVKGRGKSTEEIKAITADAVKKSSRKLKVALWLVTMLLLLSVGGGAVVLMLQREDAVTTQADLRASYERLEQLNRAGDAVRAQDAAERSQLQARIQGLTKQLEEQARGPGTRIAQEARNAVYMLAALQPDGRELGFCSAFAVAPELLATNAHCVLEMERMQREGTRFTALPNGGQGGRFGVTWMGRHPGFRPDAPDPTEDCGLVRIAGQASSQVRLAPAADLARLQPGDTIHVYGFPGNLMEARSPVATLTSGVIGRITSFDGLSAPFAQSLLLQHSAFTSPGTSGSPIFNNEGQVIGVNTGAFRRLARQTVIDPTTGKRGDVLMTQDLSGYAFGVRSDLVQALMMGLGGR
jgi:V8-like Glu-specific endopeptidase